MATDQEIADAASDAKLNALQNPLREQSGTRVIEERSAEDILKLASSASTGISQPHFGLRMTRLVPPGCG